MVHSVVKPLSKAKLLTPATDENYISSSITPYAEMLLCIALNSKIVPLHIRFCNTSQNFLFRILLQNMRKYAWMI